MKFIDLSREAVSTVARMKRSGMREQSRGRRKPRISRRSIRATNSVMPALVAGIHDFLVAPSRSKTWMAGTSPAMTSAGHSVGKDSRDIIRELEADGWRFVGASGSHHHFKHSVKPGKVTLPHPRRDLHPKTVKSIYRQAGLPPKR